MPEYPFHFFVRGYHDFEDGMGDDFEDAAGPALRYLRTYSRKTLTYPISQSALWPSGGDGDADF